MAQRIPVELIFNPNWWFRNYGISFRAPFYFDRETRIRNDVAMRRAMWQRFGMGEPDPEPRPIVGSQHVAGGFVVPALLGLEVRFEDNQAPAPVCAEMSREQALALPIPEIGAQWPMNRLIAEMDALEAEFGRVVGDFDADGVLNTALLLRGPQLFMDMLQDPAVAVHLFEVAAETQVRLTRYVRSRTGTCSVSVNRSILNVNPSIYLHSNCSVQMVSPALYEKYLLPFEIRLASEPVPYGIHHCGDNLHLFARLYARSGAVFYDVGWGSDVARVARELPDAFLNLRLSPIRMLQESAATIRTDTLNLLEAAGRTSDVGLCSINMDYGTPDENVHAMFRAAEEFAA